MSRKKEKTKITLVVWYDAVAENGWTTQETVFVTSSINSTDQRSDTSCYEMRFSYQFSVGGAPGPAPPT